MRVHFPTNGARTALKIVYLSFLSDVINFSDVFCREERWILMHPDALCREERFDSMLSTFFIGKNKVDIFSPMSGAEGVAGHI